MRRLRGLTLRRGGVRARVVRSTVAVTTAAMLATVVLVALAVARLTVARVDADLRAEIDAAAANLEVAADGTPHVDADQEEDADDAVWVFNAAGALVSSPRGAVGPLSSSLAHVRRETALEDDRRRYLASPVRARPGGPVVAVLVASQSTTVYRDTRDVAIGGVVALGVFVVVGTALLTAWTVGRTLRPVHRMTSLAAQWSDQDLDTRFALGEGGDEFTELGRTLDALLDRVATALRDEQRLTAELAHELRTPLTAIRGEAELGQLAGPPDSRYARIVALADRMSATITTLLAVARQQGGGHRRCDVHDVVTDLVSSLPAAGVEVVVDLPPGAFLAAAAPELVERAVAPVLDNAVRFAHRRVSVDAALSPTQVRIIVSDDGPGVAGVDPETVFDAGVRADDGDGAGLGLTLARRVAAAAGGDVLLTSAAHPTTFEVRLPRR
ncbi:ATP-binding protein [Spongisporangium articulatum]|uniref:histidine kinase n=1 Tax=Spongisporangium articulatum TaxID=3362603 RepID=A0ABW8AR04_9ACTN